MSIQTHSQFSSWTKPKVISIYFLLVVLIIHTASSVSLTPEYESPNNVAASAQYLSSSSNSRASSGNYYSDPKSSQQYYYPDGYQYGYGSNPGGNILSKQDYGVGGGAEDDGSDSGLYGLIGLIGLLGLVPAILPLIGPLLFILFIVLLPVILPLIGPLLPILLLPLLILALPLLLLFLPVPVITTPGRAISSSDNQLEIARMVYNAISQDECIEKYTCEATNVARSFGINTDKIFGFFLGKKQPPSSPKWIQSIARGFKSTDGCKKYSCSGKLF